MEEFKDGDGDGDLTMEDKDADKKSIEYIPLNLIIKKDWIMIPVLP